MVQTVVNDLMLRESQLLTPWEKPYGPVRIDWANPLTQGLIYAFCPDSQSPKDLITGKALTAANITNAVAPKMVGNKQGYLLDCSTAKSRAGATSWNRPTTSAMMVWVGARLGDPVSLGLFGGLTYNAGATSTPYQAMVLAHGAKYSLGGSGMSIAVSYTVGYTGDLIIAGIFGGPEYAALGNILTVFEKDIGAYQTNATSGVTELLYNSDSEIVIGMDYVGSSRSSNAACGAFFIWNRGIPVAELRRTLFVDPYQFLIPA